MIDFGLSGKRAVVSGAGYLPERAGLGWFTSLALAEAGAGIRLNTPAPVAILTPLLDKQLSTPKQAKRIRAFPVPIGGFGGAGQLADWMLFMLSDAADFLCGSVVFVDGGSDAYFRADDWPRRAPAYRLLTYLKRFRGYPASA
ncbi:MAG TPA: SDR family oxidoreductase [Mycobacterium sp.]|uniref:SDR family oxidoreductase n=1 Tax=Mycobacterium sp. TaxID=1785 RepID=UPI002D22B217|nr:SDR family oxidoreductase [Mycobacterium sp.]HXY66250.1 SDR family oxidoreductase [Mycobacterium sp.]